MTMPALWLESPLLASMMAVAVTLPGLAWELDFFVRLTTGASFMGLRSYMFDRSIPLFIAPFHYSTWGCHCFSSGSLPARLRWGAFSRANACRGYCIAALVFLRRPAAEYQLGLRVW